MHKKLLVVAIGFLLAAPTVFADSANVSIAGRVIVGVDTYKVSQGNAAIARSYSNEVRVDDQGSAFNISGTEDLGGGLKGIFLVTMPFNPDLGGLTATGNSWAGIEGAFGKIKVGRDSIHYIEFVPIELTRAGTLQDFLSMGIGLQVNGTSAYLVIPTRTSNLVVWNSPNWGGVTASLGYSTSPVGNEGTGVGNASKGDGKHLAVRYVTANPLMGGVSYWHATATDSAVSSPAGEEQSNRAWVGYRFPFGLKVGLGYDNSEVRPVAGGAFAKRTAFILPVTYTMGAHNFYLEYATAGKTSGAFQNGLATHDNTGAKQILLGWDMALSKRTFLGVFYTKLDNEANATYNLFTTGPVAVGAGVSVTGTATLVGESINQLWFGIAHSF